MPYIPRIILVLHLMLLPIGYVTAVSAPPKHLSVAFAADRIENSRLVKEAKNNPGKERIKVGDQIGEWVPIQKDQVREIRQVDGIVINERQELLVLAGTKYAIEGVDEWYETIGHRGQPVYQAMLSEKSSERLRDITSKNLGRKLAVIADGRVRIAGRIRGTLSKTIAVPINSAPGRSPERQRIITGPVSHGTHPVMWILGCGLLLLSAGGATLIYYREKNLHSKPWLPAVLGFVGALIGGYVLGVNVMPFTPNKGVQVNISLLGGAFGAIVGLMVGWYIGGKKSSGRET